MRTLSVHRVLSDVGRRLRELRIERGLTQEQLAEHLDVRPRWIQSVEGGKENLGVETLVRFANGLKTPIAEFFTPPTGPKPKPGRPRRSA